MQKTAYEMRISDWSSDVCSSDLIRVFFCDKGVHHGVCLPAQVPIQGFGVGGEACVVIGAIAGGGAVGRQSALGEFSQCITHADRKSVVSGKECVSQCRSWW